MILLAVTVGIAVCLIGGAVIPSRRGVLWSIGTGIFCFMMIVLTRTHA